MESVDQRLEKVESTTKSMNKKLNYCESDGEATEEDNPYIRAKNAKFTAQMKALDDKADLLLGA